MRRTQLSGPTMSDALATFERDVGMLALEIVRAVLADELAQRMAGLDDEPEAEAEADIELEPEPAPAPAPAMTPSGRMVWTRESVIEELSTWLLTSPSVEASFIARHGRRGLVGNAKKIFGRFDAALNAANLHIAQKYPSGPPSRSTMPSGRG